VATVAELQEQFNKDPNLLSVRDKLRLPIYAEAAKKILLSKNRMELDALKYDFLFNARPSQIEPAGDHRIWLILAGRGWG
jgi:hypothetical protein